MCMEHTDPSAVGFEDSLMRYFPEVNTLLYTFPSGTFCHNTACCRVVRLDCSVSSFTRSRSLYSACENPPQQYEGTGSREALV